MSGHCNIVIQSSSSSSLNTPIVRTKWYFWRLYFLCEALFFALYSAGEAIIPGMQLWTTAYNLQMIIDPSGCPSDNWRQLQQCVFPPLFVSATSRHFRSVFASFISSSTPCKPSALNDVLNSKYAGTASNICNTVRHRLILKILPRPIIKFQIRHTIINSSKLNNKTLKR